MFFLDLKATLKSMDPSVKKGLWDQPIENCGRSVNATLVTSADIAVNIFAGIDGARNRAAKKNPLEGAFGFVQRSGDTGAPLLEKLGGYTRTVEIRVTGDDLPMPVNRVDLDPTWVDEFGLPVARVTRDFGPHERWAFEVAEESLRAVVQPFVDEGVIQSDRDNPKISNGLVDLIGDHQLGTCRMGDDPRTSVVDRYCRVHDIENLFVVDSSVFPTGFGLNPMMTVVANALRVGTWIVQEMK